MFETVSDEVFPFIKSLGQKRGAASVGGSTYSHHMEGALFIIPTPRVLANVVDQLDSIDMGRQRHQGRSLRVHARKDRHRRTERPVPHAAPHHPSDGGHDGPPRPRDVICDPACGTAGFLVAASSAPDQAPQRHSLPGPRGAPPLSRGHVSTVMTSTTPCCASAV